MRRKLLFVVLAVAVCFAAATSARAQALKLKAKVFKDDAIADFGGVLAACPADLGDRGPGFAMLVLDRGSAAPANNIQGGDLVLLFKDQNGKTIEWRIIPPPVGEIKATNLSPGPEGPRTTILSGDEGSLVIEQYQGGFPGPLNRVGYMFLTNFLPSGAMRKGRFDVRPFPSEASASGYVMTVNSGDDQYVSSLHVLETVGWRDLISRKQVNLVPESMEKEITVHDVAYCPGTEQIVVPVSYTFGKDQKTGGFKIEGSAFSAIIIKDGVPVVSNPILAELDQSNSSVPQPYTGVQVGCAEDKTKISALHMDSARAGNANVWSFRRFDYTVESISGGTLTISQEEVGQLDTDATAFSDGSYSVQWCSEEGEGNSDALGSRYFVTRNYNQTEAPGPVGVPPRKMPEGTFVEAALWRIDESDGEFEKAAFFRIKGVRSGDYLRQPYFFVLEGGTLVLFEKANLGSSKVAACYALVSDRQFPK